MADIGDQYLSILQGMLAMGPDVGDRIVVEGVQYELAAKNVTKLAWAGCRAGWKAEQQWLVADTQSTPPDG